MRKIASLFFLTVFVSLSVGFSWVDNDKPDDEKPKYTNKQVMAKVFKGPKALKAKISKGSATAEEKKTALTYIEALAKNKPKKGDADHWKKMTGTLVKAAKDVVAEKEGAVKSLNMAANCKACHNMHK